ncbi:adenosine deaminase [Apiospora kogelbergensis]|uniref:adenosine deaminase n=1 Tax=Apiospora kogelbergensis TaxID=1337665 RepID=UPI00313016CF
MCQTALHPFLEALPKCEHHMHIEGSLEPELLFELAAKNGIALPAPSAGEGGDPAYASIDALRKRYEAFTGLDDFLGYYYIAMSALVDAADFERLGLAYFRKAAAQNVRHAEVFFDPQAHSVRGVKLSTVVEGLQAARERAERELGITSVLIMRAMPGTSAAVASAATTKGARGARGEEERASAGRYRPGLVREAVPARAVDGAVRRGEGGGGAPHRARGRGGAGAVHRGLAGHARRAAHRPRPALRAGGGRARDGGAARAARRAEDHADAVPLSNVRLRCLESVRDFPLRKLLDRGVRFSINSDDPAYFGGYILENYCALQDAFGLSVREWESIAKGAVMGSWCSDRRKAEIFMEIEAVAGEWSVGLGDQ